jgi:hypothetical protein
MKRRTTGFLTGATAGSIIFGLFYFVMSGIAFADDGHPQGTWKGEILLLGLFALVGAVAIWLTCRPYEPRNPAPVDSDEADGDWPHHPNHWEGR